MLCNPDNADNADSSTLLLSAPVPDEQEQPTLVGILRAVHMCTASVNTLKDQFGGLREEVIIRSPKLSGKDDHGG